MERVAQPTHVEQLDGGQSRAGPDAIGEREALHREPGLRARRCGPPQQRRARHLGTPCGHPPSVVAGVALLLVSGVVLLVDDDQPDVPEGRENGRARADAYAGLTAAKTLPFVKALSHPELRV